MDADPKITRRDPATLTAAERDAIARFVTRFIAYPRAKLEAVLDESDDVWLWRGAGGRLVATIAVKRLPGRIEGRDVTILYSRMLAVDPAFRRLSIPLRTALRSYVRERLRSPLRPIYWLCFAASPSSYLTMARNFAVSWPRPGVPTPPAVRALIEGALASLGIERVEEVEGCLRLPDDFGVFDGAMNAGRWDRSDGLVDFFLRVNPDYARGSDLACICPVSAAAVVQALFRQMTRAGHARRLVPSQVTS